MNKNKMLYILFFLVVIFFIFYFFKKYLYEYIKNEVAVKDFRSLDVKVDAVSDLGRNVDGITSNNVRDINFFDLTIEDKLAKEKKLNELAAKDLVVMSESTLYEVLIRKKAFIEPDMAERMKNNLMTAKDWEVFNVLVAELSSEDENFNVELAQYNNFDELKKAFDKRGITTGLFYGSDLLAKPAAYRGARAEDIKRLLDSGAVLPDDVLEHIVYFGDVDLAVDLKNSGVNINQNYVNKYTNMNAVELMAEKFVTNPYSISAEEQAIKIKKLIDLGVPIKINDGTRDPLDILLQGAYRHEPEEARKLLMLANELKQLGIPLEKSHIQLFDKIKEKNPELYEKYSNVF